MRQRSKGIGWILGIAALIVIGIVIFTRTQGPKEIQGEEIEVRKGDISTYYSFSGSIEAKNRQTIFADQALQIKEFEVQTGEVVTTDDIVYRTNRGVNIKSEIDGEVINIFVEEGEQLMPGAKVMEIVDYKNLQLKVKVDEYDLKAIKTGIPVNVTIHALDKDFQGTITDVDKEGVYMNGITFFNTTISIENEGDILGGMSAEAKVLNENAKDVAILPMSAIKFRDDNSPYINIKNNDGIEDVDVELGISDGVNVEIKSGVNIGDKVFVEGESRNRFGPPEGVRRSDGSRGES